MELAKYICANDVMSARAALRAGEPMHDTIEDAFAYFKLREQWAEKNVYKVEITLVGSAHDADICGAY